MVHAPALVDLPAADVANYPDGGWLFAGAGHDPPNQNTVGRLWLAAGQALPVYTLRRNVDGVFDLD